MKISELIDILSKEDGEREVILSHNGGNSYSPLGWVGTGLYVPSSKWYGEIYLEELTEEDRELSYSESDLYFGDDGQKAIILSSLA